MREIKFRAWDKKKKEWVNSDDMAILLHGGLLQADSFEYNYMHGNRRRTIEIMQYAGLKDKNGKEIYEGDIINAWYHDNSGGYQGEVIFEQGGFCTEFSALANYKECEVIGNIYEHPHLLK